jgi:hypothetical protein
MTVLDGPALHGLAADGKLVSLELGDAALEARWQAEEVHVRATVQDITAHDLCTHGAGISEVLLARWDVGGRHPWSAAVYVAFALQHHLTLSCFQFELPRGSVYVADAASPSSQYAVEKSPFESLGSLLDSSFPVFDAAVDTLQTPVLRLQYDRSQGEQPAEGRSGNRHSTPQTSMDVRLQPLQLMHQSSCLERLQQYMSGMPQGLHWDRVLQAINQMSSPSGRALAKAELAAKSRPLPSLHLEVCASTIESAGASLTGSLL